MMRGIPRVYRSGCRVVFGVCAALLHSFTVSCCVATLQAWYPVSSNLPSSVCMVASVCFAFDSARKFRSDSAAQSYDWYELCRVVCPSVHVRDSDSSKTRDGRGKIAGVQEEMHEERPRPSSRFTSP